MGHPKSNEDYTKKTKKKNRIKNDYCYEDVNEKHEQQFLNAFKNFDIKLLKQK